MLIEKQMRQQTVWQKELQVHLIVGFIGILKSSIQSGVVAGAIFEHMIEWDLCNTS
jgi:hypothetical protein